MICVLTLTALASNGAPTTRTRLPRQRATAQNGHTRILIAHARRLHLAALHRDKVVWLADAAVFLFEPDRVNTVYRGYLRVQQEKDLHNKWRSVPRPSIAPR